LKELREAKIDLETKLSMYDSTLQYTALPFESKYEDEVQILKVTSYPFDKSIIPLIEYKKQTVQVPQITLTLPAKEPAWYRTKAAKVIGGAIGATLIYAGTESKEPDKFYYYLIGTTVLTFSFAI